MKANWRNGIFYFLVIIIVISSVHDSQAEVIYGDRSEERSIDFPLLQIIKWSSSAETHLGNNITVNVNITNWSIDQSAFNLTITEPLFSDWAYTSFVGWDEYAYIQVDANASTSYNYTVQIKSEGKYTIGPTEISYFGIDGTEFNSRSQSIPVTIFVESPPLSLDDLWRNILFISLAILVIPVILFAINKSVWRKD